MIDAAEVERLRKMAEGEQPFRASRLLDRLSAMSPAEIGKLPQLGRQAIAYYRGARRRVESLKVVPT
jgi:hypothetical protein